MPLFAESSIMPFLIVGLLALVIVTLLIRSHRYLSRQKREQSATIVQTPRPKRVDRGPALDAPPDVLRWEVQMHGTARELSAQLDSKMGALQHLIADADRAADRLETALDRTSDAESRE